MIQAQRVLIQKAKKKQKNKSREASNNNKQAPNTQRKKDSNHLLKSLNLRG
jgi:hypothetical protein